MRPLQAIAMGLVVVALSAPLHGYDALPDPVGWTLVLLGIRSLTISLRGTLLTLGGLALAVSAVLWVPHMADRLDAVDPSLTWAANLPALATTAVLAHALATEARLAGDQGARRWLLTDRTLLVLSALLPVLVFGGDVRSLETPTYLLAGLALLMLIVLLFTYSARGWALVTPTPRETGPDAPRPRSQGLRGRE